MSESDKQLFDASTRWTQEFGCAVVFNDASHGSVHANVGDVYVGTWKSLQDAEMGIARLWMIR